MRSESRERSSAPRPMSKKVSAAALTSITMPCTSTVSSGWASALRTFGSVRALLGLVRVHAACLAQSPSKARASSRRV